MTEYNLFCYAKTYNDDDSFQQNRFRFCNKEVGKERYNEILTIIEEIFEDLKFDHRETYMKNWKQVRSEQWVELAKIPEFDRSIVESIIEFKLGCLDGNTHKNELLKKADELIEMADKLKKEAENL